MQRERHIILQDAWIKQRGSSMSWVMLSLMIYPLDLLKYQVIGIVNFCDHQAQDKQSLHFNLIFEKPMILMSPSQDLHFLIRLLFRVQNDLIIVIERLIRIPFMLQHWEK